MTIHVVRPGETVDTIAAGYGVAPRQLAEDNELPPDFALAVGQTLVVRFPQSVHVVSAGETLTSVAERYGTTVGKLWGNNWALGGGEALVPGQLLVVSYFDEKIGEGLFNGYAYPFISPELLAAELPYLSTMAPFTYGITAEGGLLPLDDEAMLEAARKRGTKPVMHLSTLTEAGQFDTGRAEYILTDYEAQGRLAAEVLQTVLRKDFAGLDVDFEYLPGQLAAGYAAFLGRLRQLLAAQGRFIRVRVSGAVGGVLLMTYEWGYTYGPPMAVAPLPNVRAVLDYAVTEIPAGKIFLGVPNYGYDWPLPFIQGETRAQSISNQRAIELAVRYGVPIQYDETARSPFFHYTDAGGTSHEVWFEDARSMDAKLRLIAEYGFRGAGFWNLMRPFSQTWLVLDSLFNIEE